MNTYKESRFETEVENTRADVDELQNESIINLNIESIEND